MRPTTTSFWRLVAVLVVVLAAYGTCVEPALFGHQRWNLGGVVGGLVGALVSTRSHDAAFWALPVVDRRRVVAARRTGVPTWDATLDLVVLDQLERAARGGRRGRVAAGVLAALFLVLPVVASVRTGTGWYLLCLVPLSVPAVLAAGAARDGNPRVRLDRFRAATEAGPEVDLRR